MSRPDKIVKSEFVIKLSCETVQKLSEEEQLAKAKRIENVQTVDTKTQGSVDKEKVIGEIIEPVLKQPSIRKLPNSKDRTSSSTTDNDVSLVEQSPEDVFNKGNEETKLEIPGDSTSDSASSSWGDYAPYIKYIGEEAVYTDPSTQHKYTWNKETNSWDTKSKHIAEPSREYSYENDKHIYTEPDGSKFFWDVDKKAWIPNVDDDFLAIYQMSYGFIDNVSKDKKEDHDNDNKKKENQKQTAPTGVKRKNEPQWFQPPEETNTKVYVSNLPQDLTEEEFVNLMQKCGLVERDPRTQKMKVKLYVDKEADCFKGDALCTYIKIESVDLALKLIDGCELKGNKIKVERAHFQQKGDYNPALKPKKKKKKELEKLKKMQQKLFDWRPEKFIGERSKHERIVIVKNLFHPTDFDKEVQLILDYQQDLREECTKSGEVRKVVIYDRHPEGVAQITMKEPDQADAVVQLINGRWFGKRQITAEIWDGRTKYRIAETDADLNKRIDGWDKFLEGKEGENKKEINEGIDAAKSCDAGTVECEKIE